MLPGRAQRRQFYLGIDFIRLATTLPKLQIWQEQLRGRLPARSASCRCRAPGDVNLHADGRGVACASTRWAGGARSRWGRTSPRTVFDLLGLEIKANPKYGSEKKGQPTTFYATFAPEPIRLNCELRHVDVVLSPDPNVFRHSNPLAGLADGGAFVHSERPRRRTQCWPLAAGCRRSARSRSGRSASICSTGSRSPAARRRTSSCATACRAPRSWARSSPYRRLAERHGLDEAKLFAGIRAAAREEVREARRARRRRQPARDRARLSRAARSWTAQRWRFDSDDDAHGPRVCPTSLDVANAEQGIGNPRPLLGAGLLPQQDGQRRHRRSVRRDQRDPRRRPAPRAT